jgi:hypothetical protein
MARYVIQRTFEEGLDIGNDDAGAELVSSVIDKNATEGVTWLHSYVSTDRTATFCVYDGPTPEAIRAAADCNGLPIDSITEVSVLDPYAYGRRR